MSGKRDARAIELQMEVWLSASHDVSTPKSTCKAALHPLGIHAISLGSPRKHNQFSSHPIKRSSFPHTYLGESGAITKAPQTNGASCIAQRGEVPS
jgi:hypothetical protein